MRIKARLLLPMVAVLAIIPALMMQTGGPHGNLYSIIVFILSIPALFTVSYLRDFDLIESEVAITASILILQYLYYFFIINAVIELWKLVRRYRKAGKAED